MFLRTTFHSFLFCALFALSVEHVVVVGRKFTVTNKCKQTIWPGIYTGNTANGKPDGVAAQGGWELGAGASSTFSVPDAWLAGRIWGRTSCDFKRPDVQSCATGSCLGGLHCTQPGIPPVTLAEFTLNAKGQDSYDVSNVDGFNVPITVTADKCPTASCPVDLNAECPAKLQAKDGAGKVVGCKSACLALGGESNCCTGAHNKPETCPSSGVAFYDYFKKKCPDSYAYAYDEKSGTALKFCSGAHDYTVTFCP